MTDDEDPTEEEFDAMWNESTPVELAEAVRALQVEITSLRAEVAMLRAERTVVVSPQPQWWYPVYPPQTWCSAGATVTEIQYPEGTWRITPRAS